MEIMPKVHLVPNIIANPYIIIDPDGLTLIDTGLPGSDKKILRYISERGFSAKDLVRIIITHSDVDHVGGLGALKRASGARVYASAIEAAAIARGQPSRRIRPARFGRRLFMAVVGRFFKAKPVQVDEILKEGQKLACAWRPGSARDARSHTRAYLAIFPVYGDPFRGRFDRVARCRPRGVAAGQHMGSGKSI